MVGPYTEYAGLRFALFLFAEYVGIVLLAGMTTVLFLGGWRGPLSGALGPMWTLLKVGAIAVLVIWVRVSWPRIREDQLQRLAWGVLVPVALVQLAITAVVVVAALTGRGIPAPAAGRASVRTARRAEAPPDRPGSGGGSRPPGRSRWAGRARPAGPPPSRTRPR